MGCTVSCSVKFPGGPPNSTSRVLPEPQPAPNGDEKESSTKGRESQRQEDYEHLRPKSKTLIGVAEDKLIFDAHCHYVNYLQQTEGIVTLSNAMEQNGVGYAVLTGCPFKKCWVGDDQPPPQHHLYDDGDLYYYSGTDGLVTSDIQQAYDNGGIEVTGKFAVMACGFNLGDYGVEAEAERALKNFPFIGFGEVGKPSSHINPHAPMLVSSCFPG